jgi:CHAT domain-containing protein
VSGNLLFSLPGTREELNTIHGRYPGRLFLGENASKENFFKAGKKYDILHLAMHTVLDTIEPMNTKLMFSSDTKDEDSQLHAYEIYSKEYASKLLVLSACNTSNGVLNIGEGVYSIARTFLLAGVRNIITTNWSVADKSSSQLMRYFYANLSEGMPTDIALQKAKIQFIQHADPTKNLPYFWAGYVSYGMPTAYHPARKYLALYILIPSTLVVLILLFIIRRLKAKS